ncbi:alpha-L RNA-binding motif-containing protein [Rickenella mellea]|uniref:Alpha-L RNA-binding motif-containing protein n=1 Tax=Rickenella mellea TaxID=50990 RepID=A0A4Y7PYS7_9AGAM|nr:alpha-L RNA-binding motif-containing protein [Rickenella mellea]
MRDRNVFGIRAALPRMSWSPANLYNLWRRSTVKSKETVFTRTDATLFQQRWIAKRLTRAYHGDYIPEKIFKRWYLPAMLPDVRPRRKLGDDKESLAKFAQQYDKAEAEKRAREEEERQALAPVGSLMWTEVERRIDVFIFRCCFAHSVYEARRLVIHGRVLLNGRRHQNTNTRLAPGDMVSVDPSAIRFLQGKPWRPYRSRMSDPQDDEVFREPALLEEAVADSSDSGEPVASAGDAVDSHDQPASSSPSAESSQDDASTTPHQPSSSQPQSSSSSPSPSYTPFTLPPYAAPFIFIPPYIEVSFQTCSAILLRYPTARHGYSEVPTPYDADGEIMRLTWEWYGRHRSRMRSRSQVARMPDNRLERRVIPGEKERPRHLDKASL